MPTVSQILDAGKYSRTLLQQKITPDIDDLIGQDPYLAMLDGHQIQFIKSLQTYAIHTVIGHEDGNLPLLAYAYHKNINTWWIIGMYNGVIDPYEDLPPGTRLNIPSLESIEDFFNNVINNISSNSRTVVLD